MKLRAAWKRPIGAAGAHSLPAPAATLPTLTDPSNDLLGASPKPIAPQLIKRSDCSVFIHLRQVREDDNSYACACAVLHEYDRFIRIRKKTRRFPRSAVHRCPGSGRPQTARLESRNAVYRQSWLAPNGEVEGPPKTARSSAVGAQSLPRPRRVTVSRSRTPSTIVRWRKACREVPGLRSSNVQEERAADNQG